MQMKFSLDFFCFFPLLKSDFGMKKKNMLKAFTKSNFISLYMIGLEIIAHLTTQTPSIKLLHYSLSNLKVLLQLYSNNDSFLISRLDNSQLILSTQSATFY